MESSYFKIQYLELVRSFVEPKEPKTFVIRKTFCFSAFKWSFCKNIPFKWTCRFRM